MSLFPTSVVHAFRGLRRTPRFSVAAIVTLAAGICAPVTMFTLVNGVILRPLPYPDANRLVTIERVTPTGPLGAMDIATIDDFAAGSQMAEGFAAYRPLGLLELGGLEWPEVVNALEVTWNFLDLLGSQPALGSYFRSEHEQGGSPVVVLTHGTWVQLFAGDPTTIGKSVRLNGRSHTIIGVTPAHLELPRNLKASVVLPLDRVGQQVDYGRAAHRGIARLKPSVSVAEFQSEVRRISAGVAEMDPRARSPEGWSLRVVDLQTALIGDRSRVFVMMLGASLVLLLMACTNVAHLFLTRFLQTRQEVAVRAALGAGVRGLLAHRLAEATIIGLSGAVVGVGLARIAVGALPVILKSYGNLNGIERLAFEPAVLAFALGLTILTSIVFALVPMIYTRQLDLSQELRSSDRRACGRGRRYRAVLFVSQAALAILMIALSGLFLRSFTNAIRTDPGFDPRGLVAVRFTLPAARYPSEEAIVRFQQEFLSNVAAAPGVQSASAALFTPLEGNSISILCSGIPTAVPDEQWERCAIDGVSDGYFEALRIPIVQGRAMARGEANVAVMNETMARRLFPGIDPIGRFVRLAVTPRSDVQVVGVSRDCRNLGLTVPAAPRLSLPLDQFVDRTFSVFLRSTLPPETLRAGVESQVRAQDPLLPIRSLVAFDVLGETSVGDLRQNSVLLGAFTVLSVVLAAFGIYAVVSFAVSQRTREIGIRMALGANTREILWMVLSQGVAQVAAGAVIGLIVAVPVGRLVQGQLFGVTAADPANLLLAIALLAVVGALGCGLPAWRAATVEPVVTLRED